MAQRKDWEDDWRAAFEEKTAQASTPKSPAKSTLSPSITHTLELAFRSYSIVSEATGVRIMPAASFVRLATDCCFVDPQLTHKHLYHIISKHAGQLVSPSSIKAAGPYGRTRFRAADADADDRLDGRTGMTFGDFVRAMEEIGEVKLGVGKNGLHRLVYLNIIRFANFEGSAKGDAEKKDLVPPKARRDGLQDPLLRLVLESSHTGLSTVQARELLDDCKSKWAEVPKTGKEINLVKKFFVDIFKDVVEAFVFFDLNGNDFITMHEFRRGLQRLKLTDVNIERVMREVDLGCKRRNGEDIDVISFIRLFAWHPVKELTEWVGKYERTKLAADVIVERTREFIRKRTTPVIPSEVDLDLITACSVLGTRWEEVRKCVLSMRGPSRSAGPHSPARIRRTPSPPRIRRSISPQPQQSQSRAWSEGLRGDSKNESLKSEHKISQSKSGDSARVVNAIGKLDFLNAVTSVPLDLSHIQIQKAFDFLDVDKQGWFHVLQAEDVLRKAGYLPRVTTAKSSSPVNQRSQDSIVQEMMSVECERTLALSALADQWASHELDLVNSRHKDRVKNVLTVEEQVRFDRATAAAQKTLTNAMEKQFSSIHQMFDERVRRLRVQLNTSQKPDVDASKLDSSRPTTESGLRSDKSSLKVDTLLEDDPAQIQTTYLSNSSRASRGDVSPALSGLEKRMRIVEGAPSHSLQQSLRRKFRNSSRLKEQGWAELLKMFDGDSDGLLTHDEFARAVQQGCAQRKETQGRESDTGDRAAFRSRHNETVGPEALSVIVRILDPMATGKIRVESLVEFVFQSSAQQSPASRSERMYSSMMVTQATASIGSQESPDVVALESAAKPSFAPGSKAQEIGANGLFAEEPSPKTLDPWATHHQLNNVIVAGTMQAQFPVRSSRHKSSPGQQAHTTASRSEEKRGSLSPTVAFAEESPLVSPILHSASAKSTFQIESPSSRSAVRRSTSAPPRSSHTGNVRPMHFANEAPGTAFRQPSPKKYRSPRRMPPTKFWEKSELPSSSSVRDTAQNIRAWLQQQAEDNSLGDFDSGMEFYKHEEAPSSPKLLSGRSPKLSHNDANGTNGWIVSPAPLSSATKKTPGSRSRQDRSGSIRHVIDTSSDTSSEERRRRSSRSESPMKKASRGRGYLEMQDKIRENLRKEWGASSESDDAWEASVTDVVLKKQMSKKYKLSPSGKQNALQLLKGRVGSPTSVGREDDPGKFEEASHRKSPAGAKPPFKSEGVAKTAAEDSGKPSKPGRRKSAGRLHEELKSLYWEHD